jgi:thioredoxin reductase
MAFQQQFVPDVENRTLTMLRPTDGGFALSFEDGSSLTAQRVIVAVGVAPFAYLPPELTGFSPELVSHSSAYHALGTFEGRDVAIVGAGASAVDIAASLHRRGARPIIVARRERLAFQDAPRNPQGARPLSQRMRWPRSGIGNGWKSVACASLPWAFRSLPEQFRLNMVRTHLGPAPCWFTKSEIEGNVPTRLGRTIRQVETTDGKVRLRLNRRDGGEEELRVDHVIAATGFRPDVARLGFIPDELRTSLATTGAAPALSSSFESNVKGLYFVGPIAANTFGPLARFAFGADFATRQVMHHFPAPEPRFITRGQMRRTNRPAAQ